MKVIRNPKREEWASILRRPGQDMSDIEQVVRTILKRVKVGGDTALRELTRELDDTDIVSPLVTEDEIERATARVPKRLREGMEASLLGRDLKVGEITPVVTLDDIPAWVVSSSPGRIRFKMPSDFWDRPQPPSAELRGE